MSAQANPSNAEEFAELLKLNRYGVRHYRDALCILYAKAENYQLSLDRWKVSMIRTYKDKATVVKHEYLVATLRDAGGQELNVRMERRFQPSSTTSSIAAFGSSSSRSDVTTSTGIQEKEEKFRKWAADEISICSSNTFGNDQVQVDLLRFRDGRHASRPRLAQLVVLACAISDSCATYNFMQSNCYWFCYVALEVLKKRFQVDHVLESVEASSQLGRWNGIPARSSSGIEEALKSYDESWRDFDDKVSPFIPLVDHTYVANRFTISSIILTMRARERLYRRWRERKLEQIWRAHVPMTRRRGERTQNASLKESRHLCSIYFQLSRERELGIVPSPTRTRSTLA